MHLYKSVRHKPKKATGRKKKLKNLDCPATEIEYHACTEYLM